MLNTRESHRSGPVVYHRYLRTSVARTLRPFSYGPGCSPIPLYPWFTAGNVFALSSLVLNARESYRSGSLSLGTFGSVTRSNICSPLRSTPTTRSLLPATRGLLRVAPSLSPWESHRSVPVVYHWYLRTSVALVLLTSSFKSFKSSPRVHAYLPATRGLLRVASSLPTPLVLNTW